MKNIKLKKGMCKEYVNAMLINTKLLDSEYLGWEHIHTWLCPECGEFSIHRSWRDLRKGIVKCDECRFGIKDKYDYIGDVYIRQGMTKEEVNGLISEWLLLEDDVYLGVKHIHNWKCKCGNVIKNRTFDTIRNNESILCGYCVRNTENDHTLINTILSKHMTNYEVNELISEWIEFEDDVYMGNSYKHNWKCKCGNIFKRSWMSIKQRGNINCGCHEYNKQEKRYKYEVEKTGEYEYIRSFRKGDTMPDGRVVNHVAYAQVKHKYCGSIYESPISSFMNKIASCQKCCNKYENSFAYHIEVELGESLDKYWDFDKNTLNPYHIWKSGAEKVWIKCQDKDYHGSYDTYCYSFKDGGRCSYCYNRKVHKKDSFGAKNPEKVKYWHEDNDKSPYEVAPNSAFKFKFRCDSCENTWYTTLGNVNNGCWCPVCSASKGEKKVKVWLDANDINYIYDEPYFNDLLSDLSNQLRPDFILPEHKIWIEYDGEFHYKKMYDDDNHDVLKIHDKRKDEYAKDHGWKMIRIPYWEFDNIEEILIENII